GVPRPRPRTARRGPRNANRHRPARSRPYPRPRAQCRHNIRQDRSASWESCAGLDSLGHGVPVVEGVHLVADLLAGLVALARDYHGVSSTGDADRIFDRLPAAGHFGRPCIGDMAVTNLAHDGTPDRRRVLMARVVVGDYDDIGIFGCG